MERSIKDILNNKGGNYILPFFWQMGVEESVLREYMGAIQDCDIHAVTLESRTHEDYAGPGWWHDVDIIMDEAKKRDMKIWILDDKRFPTGYANGSFEKPENKHKRRHYIYFNTVDLYEADGIAEIDLSGIMKYKYTGPTVSLFGPVEIEHSFDNDEVLSVTACRIDGGERIGEIIDVFPCVSGGTLKWNVPHGTAWRIYVCFKTYNGADTRPYMNLLDSDSVQVLIDAVYEPHFQRYGDEFGKTLVGFFSDEPNLGNIAGYDFDARIGKKMPLPWGPEMPEMLRERLGDKWKTLLPMLWTSTMEPGLAAGVRHAYMDAVTELVARNFTGLIGKWCADRGVSYIGHHIEDNNAHGRMGCSTGHFFRGMDGQHYGGIDIIASQVIPGAELSDRSGRGAGDAEFFHYTLSKLASSHGHIDPKKQGRSMCEMFGASGWGMSTRKMKYILDHLLVRGVNNFVPHAFSPAPFPHEDCPPHFYAHGENPLYGYFSDLMHYTNRLGHIFNGGTHIAPAALLYHADMEWCGEAMLNQKPARAMTEGQIDFDIIPADVFSMADKYNTSFNNGRLHVNGEEYRALVIPRCEFLPKSAAEFIADAAGSGFTVAFIDAAPSGVCGVSGDEAARLMSVISQCPSVTLDGLCAFLEERGVRDIKVSPQFKKLVYYRYRRDSDVYMLTNEDVDKAFEGTVFLPTWGTPCEYDGFANAVRPLEYENCDGGVKIKVKIQPYNSLIVTFDGEITAPALPEPSDAAADISRGWRASFCENKEYPNFAGETELDELISIGEIKPTFSGHTRYVKEIETDGGDYILDIENAFEGAAVWVNGTQSGVKCFPPYRFYLHGLKNGKNEIVIEAANCLDRKVSTLQKPSPFMPLSAMRASGIVGKVTLSKIK